MTIPSKELFKKIRRIQIQSAKLANDLFAGAYHSVFKGKGMEFEDVREYFPGDDVRSIDWNVTARMQKPYVKNFREERELNVCLIVDVSASCFFGSALHPKSEWIAEIASVIAFSALKNNDKIGLILFSNQVEKYISPKKGTRHVLRIIRELLAFEPQHRGTDLEPVMSFLGKVLNRRGICFLISDFQCKLDKHELSLISRKHDLIPIAISDPIETIFPKIKSLIQMKSLESGETYLVDTSNEQVVNTFRQNAEKRMDDIIYLFKTIGVDLIQVQTGESYLTSLRKFFKIRRSRQL